MPQAFHQRFARLGITPRNRYFPALKLYQSFVTDPNGLLIEINFTEVGDPAEWAGGENYATMPRIAETVK